MPVSTIDWLFSYRHIKITELYISFSFPIWEVKIFHYIMIMLIDSEIVMHEIEAFKYL